MSAFPLDWLSSPEDPLALPWPELCQWRGRRGLWLAAASFDGSIFVSEQHTAAEAKAGAITLAIENGAPLEEVEVQGLGAIATYSLKGWEAVRHAPYDMTGEEGFKAFCPISWAVWDKGQEPSEGLSRRAAWLISGLNPEKHKARGEMVYGIACYEPAPPDGILSQVAEEKARRQFRYPKFWDLAVKTREMAEHTREKGGSP